MNTLNFYRGGKGKIHENLNVFRTHLFKTFLGKLKNNDS